MDNTFDINGLVTWSEKDIKTRNWLIDFFSISVRDRLLGMNQAWSFEQIEAPLLMPVNLLSDAYDAETDVFDQRVADEHDHWLILRPETTASSYAHMMQRLESHDKVRLPYCCWQYGKSFRREQIQPVKHMRLKEFYQLEFQCAYSADSGNDYHGSFWPRAEAMFHQALGLPTRIIESDRLPSYSTLTMDVEVNNGEKWMELCSISKRTDFPTQIKNKDVAVLEIAIGLDRCIYCFNNNP